jgi:hypothetical protein
VGLSVNYVFGSLESGKSSKEEVLVLRVEAVILNGVTDASNFFH